MLSFLAIRHLADSAEILADLVPWIYRASISFAYYPLWLAGVREGAAPLWCLRVRFLTFPRLVFFFLMRNPLRRFYRSKEKLDYTHRNPVQRKLVLHPKDWPWSSWAHYTDSH